MLRGTFDLTISQPNNAFSTPNFLFHPTTERFLYLGSAVLKASPGSGKTTIVPLELLNEAWMRNKKIITLQPRCIAARTACYRMAQLLDESPGNTVDYHIRYDRVYSDKTRIEVVTEGILRGRLQNDSDLSDKGS